MANNINKKILAKKDMNFFAEFTASAEKTARMLTYAILGGVGVVAIIVMFIVIGVINNIIIKSQIAAVEAKLASDQYATVEADAELLAKTYENKNNYYYSLTQMKKNVDETPAVPMELPDLIAKNIPSDSWIESYTITGDTLEFTGYSFTYYSAVDMVNMLNDSDVFTSKPIITIGRVTAPDVGAVDEIINTEDNSINSINNYYSFDVEGTLVKSVYVSVARYLDGETISSLGGIETLEKDAGEIYEIKDITTYTDETGATYTLSRITIDGVDVDEESFTNIVNANSISKVAATNSDINLYYTSDAAATESSTTQS